MYSVNNETNIFNNAQRYLKNATPERKENQVIKSSVEILKLLVGVMGNIFLNFESYTWLAIGSTPIQNAIYFRYFNSIYFR